MCVFKLTLKQNRIKVKCFRINDSSKKTYKTHKVGIKEAFLYKFVNSPLKPTESFLIRIFLLSHLRITAVGMCDFCKED